jgi:multiple sugar transport system substrate-binding protein
MKKNSALRLGAVLVVGSLVLAGCSSNDPAPSSTNSKVDSAVAQWAANIKKEHGGSTVTIAAQTHPSTQSMQKMTAQFEALTGIKVVWDIVDQNSLKQKIELDFQSGNAAYDVNMIDSFWLSGFTEKGVVDDVSSRISDTAQTPAFFDYADILPAYREGLDKYNGKTYGVQIAGESRFLGYRTDLFKKYNKQPPKTMDEFLELAKFFNGKESGLYGVAMRGQKGIHFTSGMMTLMYQFSEGFFDPKTGANQIDSADNVKALEYYIELLKNAPKDVGSYTHEEALSAFMSGHTAMWFDATAIAPSILDPAQSTIVDKVAFAGPPAGPKGTFGALAGWSLGVANKSKNKDAAWAFIVYMTSKAMAPTYMENGGVPTRTSVLENPTKKDQKVYFPAMLDALAASSNLVKAGISWLPQVPNSDEKLTIIGNYGSEALVGSISTKEALTKAKAEVAAIK